MRNGTEGNLTGRIISAVLVSILSGLWIHNDYVRWHQRGRDAYLSYQAHRFDQFMASPRPAFITIIGALIVVGILLGIYELIAAGAAKLINSSESVSAPAPQPRDFR